MLATARLATHNLAHDALPRSPSNGPTTMPASRFLCPILLALLALLFCTAELPAVDPATTPSADSSQSAAAAQLGMVDPPLPDGTEAGKAQIGGFRVPQPLVVELFAAEPQLASPVAIGLDEQNRVYVAEEFRFNRGTEENRTRPFFLEDDLQLKTTADRLVMYEKYADRFEGGMNWFRKYSDQIRCVVDTDGDGKADQSTVFLTGLNDPLDGLASGVLAYRGNIYVTNIPKLYALRDDDGNGVADEKHAILDGFGVNCAFLGHDLHGLVIGPDGRLYFSVGDRGFHVKTKEGTTLSQPRRGAVFRCELDGSKLEVVHTGLRNPQELAFTDKGQLFTADNNCDKGDHSRLVWILKGADSGWNMAYQTIPQPYETGPWHAEKIWYVDGEPSTIGVRPACYLPPVGKLGAGPSGLAFHSGVGFAPELRGRFFHCNYTGNGGIESIAIERSGSSYKITKHEDFLKPISATDCDFGYDGKLYVSDFVGLDWSGKSRGGRIYTVSDPSQKELAITKEVQRFFAEGFEKKPSSQLASILAHDDYRARHRAQLMLVERATEETKASKTEAFDLLMAAAKSDESLKAKLHGIWGLGILMRTPHAIELNQRYDAATLLLATLDHPDIDIVAAACTALGEAYSLFPKALQTGVPAKLEALAASDDPARAFHALMALGDCGTTFKLATVLQTQLPRTETDTYLRHAVVYYLVHSASIDNIVALAKSENANDRLVATLVLRRWSDPTELGWKRESDAKVATAIQQLLEDADLVVATEAARVVNDLPIPALLPALANQAQRLTQGALQVPDALARRVIEANFALAQEGSLDQLIAMVQSPLFSVTVRQETLAALRVWDQPSQRNRATGVWREVSGGNQQLLDKRLKEEVPRFLAAASSDLIPQIIELIDARKLATDDTSIVDIATNDRLPATARAFALKILVDRKSPQAIVIATKFTSDPLPAIRVASLEAFLTLDQQQGMAKLLARLSSADAYPSEKQAAIRLLSKLDKPEAIAAVVQQIEALKSGDLTTALRLEAITAAAEPKVNEKLSAEVKQLLADRAKLAPIERLSTTLEGGNADLGRDIFYGHAQAQCARCHKIEERGGIAGPDLSGIGLRGSREHLLESIITPDTKIAPGFGTINLLLADGTTVTGVIKEENEQSIMLELASGEKRVIAIDDIEQRSTPKSAMPQMLTVLSESQIRDLIEYLSQQKIGPKPSESE